MFFFLKDIYLKLGKNFKVYNYMFAEHMSFAECPE